MSGPQPTTSISNTMNTFWLYADKRTHTFTYFGRLEFGHEFFFHSRVDVSLLWSFENLVTPLKLILSENLVILVLQIARFDCCTCSRGIPSLPLRIFFADDCEARMSSLRTATSISSWNRAKPSLFVAQGKVISLRPILRGNNFLQKRTSCKKTFFAEKKRGTGKLYSICE